MLQDNITQRETHTETSTEPPSCWKVPSRPYVNGIGLGFLSSRIVGPEFWDHIWFMHRWGRNPGPFLASRGWHLLSSSSEASLPEDTSTAHLFKSF
ncbi:hypothetical protein LEMLEM_LOCUS12202 [Lemmus lemmus]